MKKVLIFFLIFLMGTMLFAEKKPFSIEALYKLKSIYDPQVSPDGKWVAFVVTSYDLYKSERNSDIYLISVDGKKQKRLTTFKGADFHPRWSKDGKYIYFLSTRKNGVQLWKIAVDGGEPQKLTDLNVLGLNNVFVLENGKKLLFSTKIFPECGSDLECSKKINDQMESGPVQAHYAKELLYRHWTEYRDGKYEHTFLYFVDADSAVDLTPWNYDAPMFSLGGETVAISPDEKMIAVVSNHDKNQATSTNGDIWLISLKDNSAKNITKDNPAWDGEPVFSPNGRYIAYKTQKIPGYESDLFRLAIYDIQTGQKKVLTEGKIDNWVGAIVWSPDSRAIYFTVEEKGHYPVYKIDLKSEKIKKVFDAATIRGLTITPDGKYFLFTRSTISSPYELYRIQTNGKKLTRLTFFNKPVEDEYDFRPAQEMWITGADGKKIQTWVITPHNFDPNKKYPMIINVHGGPQQMWYDGFRGDWQVYPGHGYVVAFCNPHGSPGYGQKFVEAISKDWGGKVYEDIMKVTDSLASIPWIDENRLGAMGWSYGGYMMMWLEGHTDKFKAIVAMMGVYDLRAMYGATEELWFPEWELGGAPWESPDMYKKWSPSNYVTNFKTPCLVITGERDYRVPYTQSLEFFTDLQKMGVPSELIVFENDGHWPDYLKSMPLYYNAHLYWFHKYLGGDPAPFKMEDLIYNKVFKK